jgi:hypothetical protein
MDVAAGKTFSPTVPSGGSDTFGTLTVEGTGATAITSGTLQLRNGTTNGSIQNSSSIVDNAILKFMETGGFSPTPNITGSGAIVDADLIGVLALAGKHTGYTGSPVQNTGGGTFTW